MNPTLYALYVYGDEHKAKDKRDLVGIFDCVKIHGIIRELSEELGLDRKCSWQDSPTKYNLHMSRGTVEDYALNEIALLSIRQAEQRKRPWDW